MRKLTKILAGALAALGLVTVAATAGVNAEITNLVYTCAEGAALSTNTKICENDIAKVEANRILTPTANKSTATVEGGTDTFAYGLLPGGNTSSTANAALKVTSKVSGAKIGVYYTLSDGKFSTNDQSKSGSLKVFSTGDAELSTKTAVAGNNKVAYYADYTINSADTTVYIGSTANRLTVMGIVLEQGEAATEYTVTVMDGSSVFAEPKVVENESLSLAPKKLGYKFEGFYDDEAFTQSANLKITASKTIYIKWTRDELVNSNANVLPMAYIEKMSNQLGNSGVASELALENTIYGMTTGTGIVSDTSSNVNETSTKNALKQNGSMGPSGDNIVNGFTITTLSKGTLKFYARSTNSTTDRALGLYNSEKTNLLAESGLKVSKGNDGVKVYSISIPDAGKYYFGGTDGGIYLYTAEFIPETVNLAAQFDKDSEPTAVRFIGKIECENIADIENITLTLTLSGEGKEDKVADEVFATVYTAVTDLTGCEEAANTYYAVLVVTDLATAKAKGYTSINASLSVKHTGADAVVKALSAALTF